MPPTPTLLALSGPTLSALAAAGTFTLLGALLLARGLASLALDRAILRWPRAPGQILRSTYQTHEGSTRVDGIDIHSTNFTPVITYRYTVAGHTYAGTRLARSERRGDANTIKQIVDRYPDGSAVQVYYSPHDPGTAYLETHRSTGALVLVLLGSFFALAGLGTLALVALAA